MHREKHDSSYVDGLENVFFDLASLFNSFLFGETSYMKNFHLLNNGSLATFARTYNAQRT